ncbi:MAG: molybdate ABC transporter permease subunit [Candidatus Nitrotoga sp.]|nr:molybdate ABC transporter permease subunit [Candidatus Nitrotoga sp.]MDO9447522.1 molybdate ABC transporter permease subunit [Candidatus Nitrotoga sp.]MDP3497735.1 molybdate ABC transporter permease subunit [Candidatus Nitrotoga sp.]
MSLTAEDWTAIWLTIQLCLCTTLILMVVATPLAWWLTSKRSTCRTAVQAVVALPLVLPPTVLGFYLLIALGPRGFIGGTLEDIGLHHLAFTFEGILIGSVLYSLPFAVQPLEQAFANLGRRPIEVAASLGAGVIDRFISVVLPMTKSGFIVAMTLTFAHTMGEFGVVLMVGGNIPGVTHVLSTTIYGYTEGMQYAAAGRLSLMLLIFAFIVLFVVYWFNRGFEMVKP